MFRIILRTLGFKGLIQFYIGFPFFYVQYNKYENQQRKIAESYGLSLEEFRIKHVVHRDGTPLTEAEQREREADFRKRKLEEYKLNSKYNDF